MPLDPLGGCRVRPQSRFRRKEPKKASSPRFGRLLPRARGSRTPQVGPPESASGMLRSYYALSNDALMPASWASQRALGILRSRYHDLSEMPGRCEVFVSLLRRFEWEDPIDHRPHTVKFDRAVHRLELPAAPDEDTP